MCQSKNSVEKAFSPVFFTHRITHPTTPHTPTRPHTHNRYQKVVSYNSVDAASAITAVASRPKPAWRTPSPARQQQRVPHDSSSSSTRYPCHFSPKTATPAVCTCNFIGFRLSATPRAKLWRLSAKPIATNSLGQRFVAHEARVAREERAKHRAANRFSTAR